MQNPLNAVGKLIASFQDADGNILVEGLYDDVVKLTAEERASLPPSKSLRMRLQQT